jgi:hypothetical protein
MMFSVRDVYAITNDTRLGKALEKILLANLPLAVLCIVYRTSRRCGGERAPHGATLALPVR